MKKFVALMMTLMLALGAVGAMAEVAEEPEVFINPAPELHIAFNEAVRSSAFPATEDQLSLENGVYTLLSNGITMVISPPFGVLTLTQDMKNQLQDYMLLNDGRSTAEFLIQNGLNAAFLDQAGELEVWLFISPTKVSQLFVDSDADFEGMMALLQTLYTEESALNQVAFEDQRWVSVRDKSDTAEFLIYYRIKNGLRVALQIRGETITPEMVTFLDSIAESIAFPAVE